MLLEICNPEGTELLAMCLHILVMAEPTLSTYVTMTTVASSGGSRVGPLGTLRSSRAVVPPQTHIMAQTP